jgi:hypothetical protein
VMVADSLRFIVHPIVLSGVFSRCSPPCRRACRASASAPHFTQHPNVQASRLERARPMAVGTFPGALAACTAAAPGRRSLERKRQAKAEGKIEGCGTPPPANPVCTWGWRGTRPIAAPCRETSQRLTPLHKTACHTRPDTLAYPGITS